MERESYYMGIQIGMIGNLGTEVGVTLFLTRCTPQGVKNPIDKDDEMIRRGMID